jgi:SAM-dependent methyltransferase
MATRRVVSKHCGAAKVREVRVPKPVHPFAARMAASIPWKELRRHNGRPLRVLDPMAGSGTTLVVARTLGHKATGFDTDPLAVLLARVWCRDADEAATLRTAARIREAAKIVAARVTVREAYPIDADDETRAFVRYWFDARNRRQLAALAQEIRKVRRRGIRDILWCAFSRLIITKQAGASLALDIAHSRPHKVSHKTVIRPIAQFERAVRAVLAVAPFKTEARKAEATIRRADARRLPVRASTIDIAICSPPYLNAIDYLRGHKFSLVWMGHSIDALRRVRSTNIGTEVSTGAKLEHKVISHALQHMGNLDRLPDRQKRLLGRYVADMDKALCELHRVLVRGGRAVLVVGDCTMRGVYVRNSGALAYLGKRHGFDLARRRRRKLPPNRRYLPPPSSRRSGRMLRNRLRAEVLLDFIKT